MEQTQPGLSRSSPKVSRSNQRLSRSDRGHQDEDEDEDIYTPKGIGPSGLRIGLIYDGHAAQRVLARRRPELKDRHDPRGFWSALREEYPGFIESELNSAPPDRTWIGPDPEFIPSTAGPGIGGDEVRLAWDLVNSFVSAVADWAGAGAIVLLGIRRLRRLIRKEPLITSGAAVALAAHLLEHEHGQGDLAFSFVAEMQYRVPGNEYPAIDGYIVGFRSRKRLWLATVDLLGTVTSLKRLNVPPTRLVRLAEGVMPSEEVEPFNRRRGVS